MSTGSNFFLDNSCGFSLMMNVHHSCKPSTFCYIRTAWTDLTNDQFLVGVSFKHSYLELFLQILFAEWDVCPVGISTSIYGMKLKLGPMIALDKTRQYMASLLSRA